MYILCVKFKKKKKKLYTSSSISKSLSFCSVIDKINFLFDFLFMAILFIGALIKWADFNIL